MKTIQPTDPGAAASPILAWSKRRVSTQGETPRFLRQAAGGFQGLGLDVQGDDPACGAGEPRQQRRVPALPRSGINAEVPGADVPGHKVVSQP